MCSLKRKTQKDKDKDTIEKMESPGMGQKKRGWIFLANFFFKMAKSMW
jgi:hypothetical protein